MVLGTAPAAVLAFDVGGTDIKAGLVDHHGRVLAVRRVPTPLDPTRPGEVVIERLADLANELTTKYPEAPAKAAGIIVPGIVETEKGIGVYSANLRWRNFPFVAAAEKCLRLPVAFDHDVRSAAAVEHRFGGSRQFNEVVVIIVGTGIAAAVFSDGKAITAGGFAGELGHAMVPDPDAAPGTRRSTVLEAVGSAGAIAKRYTAQSGSPVTGAKAVLNKAQSGDDIAARVWHDAMDALAFTICQCVNIIGTEAVVIGGGLAEAGEELLLEPLRRRVDSILDFHRRPQIIKAQLGQDAGLLGAALNARALLERTP
ncbi:ROK family protein [Paenarthrobacter ureafaciens]|uniref:ROK family protein n=1 Tax=Paenarthrobacter ureafaciens TaxID=37931 RepID=UPI003CEF58DD